MDGCTVLLWIAKIAVRESQNGLPSQARSQATNSLPAMSSDSESGTLIQASCRSFVSDIINLSVDVFCNVGYI